MVWTEQKQNVKERWQENTEQLYKKDLHDPDNHDGVIIWVVKIFFVYFYVFFPPCLNIFLVAQLVKNLPAMWETWVQFLGL